MRIRIVAGLFILIASTLIPAVDAFATLNEATLQSYGISQYDPNFIDCSGDSAGATAAPVGNDNIEKILRYFVGKGLTLAQAAGIGGNISRESSYNPAKIQGGKIAPSNYIPVSGTGFGLVQWTFSDRQKPLEAFAASQNKTIIDLGMQLDYIWKEMNSNRAGTLSDIQKTTTADDAAYIFHKDFEGSADTPAMVKANRGGDALALYAKYKSIIPDGSTDSTTTGACSGDGSASTAGTDGFVVYNQDDAAWAKLPYGSAGTIGAGGCGPSAMAMIITSLTGKKVTPADTAAYGAANGTLYLNGAGGSLHNVDSIIGSHWGLKSTRVDGSIAKINAGLRAGGEVIVVGGGPGRAAAPFTLGGHFIVIRAIAADGKWLIGDSNGSKGQDNSKKEWDPAFIMSEDSSGYAAILTK